MSAAICLLAYSLVVLVLGPPLLRQASASGANPRLGIAVWGTAMISVLGAWVAAAALAAVDLHRHWYQFDRLLAGCFAVLRALATGGYGPALQVGLALLTALSVLAMGVLALRAVAALQRGRRHTREHTEAAHLAARGGARGPGGALIVDAPASCVYCLPGRPRTIVISRPALAALTEAQMDAVLTHERAHLDGHHHLLLASTRALARALPGSQLFAEGNSEIARLAEMCADDVAAHQHGRRTVVDALLAVALPPSATGAAEPALGAAGLAVADRVERLLTPSYPARARLIQLALLGAFLFVPLVLTVLIVAGSPLCITPNMS